MSVPRERLFTPPTTGLGDTAMAALLLSAAVHAGAILWTAGGADDRTLAVPAGGATVVEVTLVEGSADGAAGDAGGGMASRVVATPPKPPEPPPEPQSELPAREAVPPVAHARPDRAVSADRLPQKTPAAAPPPEAAPVPLPKPSPPAAATPPAPQLAALPDSGLPGRHAADDARAAVGRGGAPGATGGGTEGAAPRADNPAPRYPYAARRRGQEGRVLLRVEVLPSGEAGQVEVMASSGVVSLDRAAADAVRRWRFRPAQRGGVPVRATVQVPVRFALK